MNINFLEKETWAERSGPLTKQVLGIKIEGTRVGLFELLDVPKNLIEQLIFSKSQEEVNGEMKTFESLRSFSSLPLWLKKRIKFRLKHRVKFPEFDNFLTQLES
jgi:hypothetical protein